MWLRAASKICRAGVVYKENAPGQVLDSLADVKTQENKVEQLVSMDVGARGRGDEQLGQGRISSEFGE